MSTSLREPILPLSKETDTLVSKSRKHCEAENEEVIDDWGLSSANFHMFAQHEARNVYMIPSSRYSVNRRIFCLMIADDCSKDDESVSLLSFSVLCIEALTPIDMIQLGSGIHDATGHCVWMGAFLFLASLENILFPYFNADKETTDFCASMCKIYKRQRVLELGCGTGVGSIGVWTAYKKYYVNENDNCEHVTEPWITMTDADPEALDLCRRNCQHNNIPVSFYRVHPLCWGEDPLPEHVTSMLPYDTAFATDVLYDINLLRPLLRTAHLCLKDKGFFILAHVPRAYYDSLHEPVPNLEDYIVQCATIESGFCLQGTFRPKDCCRNDPYPTFPKDALNSTTLQQMEEVGAAIFVFQKAM